ncbi:MAG: hypothetical protein AAGB32_06300 [Pseudomonadota bacterium]
MVLKGTLTGSHGQSTTSGSSVKTTITNDDSDAVFFDSNAREIKTDDQIQIITNSGNVKTGTVTGIGKNRADRLTLGLVVTDGGRTSISQDSVLNGKEKIISLTAKEQRRRINRDFESRLPKIESKVKKTF